MPNNKLLVFGRYPRHGHVKTRLASFLTDRGCYQLHQVLLLDTVDRTCHLDVERYLYLAGCSLEEANAFGQNHFQCDINVGVQQGSDLGERMWQAYSDIRSHDDSVVLLGTDSPSVPLSYIRSAFEALSRVSVVLGPVADGGYYLLGLSKPHHELFKDISWGSQRVLQETLAKLSGETYEILPEWYDIDLKQDLTRLADDLDGDFEGFPKRTQSLFEAWGMIGSRAHNHK